jgi:hypothetical protein
MIDVRVQEIVRRLPADLQAEVLDFAEYLAEKSGTGRSDDDWSRVSLEAALRGMEDEPVPDYSVEDLKEVFA